MIAIVRCGPDALPGHWNRLETYHTAVLDARLCLILETQLSRKGPRLLDAALN